MCETMENGGAMCTSHTRPLYEALLEAINSARGSDGRKRVRSTFQVDGCNALNIVANYGSTATGAKRIATDIARFEDAPSPDRALTAFFITNLKRGMERGTTSKVATKQVRDQKRREHAAVHGWRQTGSKDFMRPTKGLDPAKAAANAAPQVVTDGWWNPSKNDGVSAFEVSRGSNNELVATHPACGHDFTTRVNLLVPALEAGRTPRCGHTVCAPKRGEAFQRAQGDLTGLVDALNGNPAAFNTLSPALQYTLLKRYGFIVGGLGRDLGVSIVHGDLTLADIVNANQEADLAGRVRDAATEDEEEALAPVIELSAAKSRTTNAPVETAVDDILSATGVLDVVPGDAELTDQVISEGIDNLWNRLLDVATNGDASAVQGFLTMVSSRSTNRHASGLAEQFVADVAATQEFPLPSGYRIERPDGIVRNPTLSQRRFARLAVLNRQFADLSEPGAGKTIGVALAVGGSGAQEALVVCPNAVVTQWSDEWKSAYGDSWEVRIGLPVADMVTDRPAVWIVNYDKFQADPAVLRKALKPFTNRVGAIAFDEIHMALRRGDSIASRRRELLEWMTDAARAANPDLMVLGASATPVVNDLEEGQSVLRLLEGRDSKPLATKPSIHNAATAYRRFKAISVRHSTKHGVNFRACEHVIDATKNLTALRTRMKGCGGAVHPSVMERALLDWKIPALVEKAREAIDSNGSVLVYSEYVEEMIDPIVQALTDAGMTVARYTGQEADAERADNLAAFINGDVQVLVGSKPIATGVDGMQAVCRHAIVVSPPWTAAADDQFVGRLLRPGQGGDVTVTYLVVEAKVGDQTWSWDRDTRLARIQFKRSLADAVTTGVIPEGILGGATDSMRDALVALAA